MCRSRCVMFDHHAAPLATEFAQGDSDFAARNGPTSCDKNMFSNAAVAAVRVTDKLKIVLGVCPDGLDLPSITLDRGRCEGGM